MKIKNKKADEEISWGIMLTVIIIAISFAVILLVLSQLNFSGQITKETCSTSVTLKKTVGDKPVIGGKWVDVPLKCKTDYVCLTTGSNDKTNCDTLLGKTYTKVSISSENEIYKYWADSLAECWSMMGESKGGMVFSGEFFALSQTSRGVICSIIGSSDNIKQKYPQLSTLKFYNYMNTEKVPEKTVTYSQYLSNINNPTVKPFAIASEDVTNDVKIPTNSPFTVVFVEYDRSLFFTRTGAATGTIAAGAIYGSVVPGAGTVVGLTVGAVIAIGGGIISAKTADALESYYKDNKEGDYSSVYFRLFNAKQLQDLHISDFQSIS